MCPQVGNMEIWRLVRTSAITAFCQDPRTLGRLLALYRSSEYTAVRKSAYFPAPGISTIFRRPVSGHSIVHVQFVGTLLICARLNLGPENLPNGGAMTIQQLIAELQRFPPDTEVNIYLGKCCDVQPIHRVHFQPSESECCSFVVLVDDTVQDCVPGRCNCS